MWQYFLPTLPGFRVAVLVDCASYGRETLGERCNRTAEVVGSIPTSSTIPIKQLRAFLIFSEPEIQPDLY